MYFVSTTLVTILRAFVSTLRFAEPPFTNQPFRGPVLALAILLKNIKKFPDPKHFGTHINKGVCAPPELGDVHGLNIPCHNSNLDK